MNEAESQAQANALARQILNLVVHSNQPHDQVMGALLGVYQGYAMTYACCADGVRACLHGVLAQLDQRDGKYEAEAEALIKRLSGPVPPATH